MRTVIAIGFCALLTGCLLSQPPTRRTVDANRFPQRAADNLENNTRSTTGSGVTISGRFEAGVVHNQ